MKKINYFILILLSFFFIQNVEAKRIIKTHNILNNVDNCSTTNFPACIYYLQGSSANLLQPWQHSFTFKTDYDLTGSTEFEIGGIYYYWETQYPNALTNGYNVSVTAVYDNGNAVPCDVSGIGMFNISCPSITTNKLHSLLFTSFGPINVKIGLNYVLSLVRETSNEDLLNAANQNSQNEINAMNKNQQQQNQNSQNEVNATNKNTEATKEQTNTIKDSNVDVDGSFFSGFDNETHGLTSIVTAPLQFIGSITSSTCTPLGLPMPFGLPSAELPCMSSIYQEHFGVFFTLYQTITFGMISYWVSVNIFAIVKGLKDPDSDKVEVLDL